MKQSNWSLIIVIALSAILFSLTVNAATIETKFDLWNSNQTLLRGANIWQVKDYNGVMSDFTAPGKVGPVFTQEDIDALAEAGANYVMISHPGIYDESVDSTGAYSINTVVKENLDSLLAMIKKADMFAVIAFRTGPGRSEFTFARDEVGDWFSKNDLDESMWTDSAKQAAWIDMWKATAQLYKDNPIVVGYYLMVEPNSNDLLEKELTDSYDPAEFYASTYAGSLYDWNQLYPKIINGIRSIDNDTPIIVGAMAYSAVNWLPYLEKSSDSKVIYSVHQYHPFTYTHQENKNITYPGQMDLDYDGTKDSFDSNWLNSYLSPIASFKAKHNVPVVINEFGLIRYAKGGDQFVNDEMTYFENNSCNHAIWMWYPAAYPSNGGSDEFNFNYGPDANNHSPVESSVLLTVIKTNWAKNAVRPSNATFSGGTDPIPEDEDEDEDDSNENDATAIYLAPGSLLNVAAADLGIVAFAKRPKVFAETSDDHFPLQVLTKICCGNPATEFDAVLKKKIKLCDKSDYKGTTISDALAKQPVQDKTITTLTIETDDADYQLSKTIYLACPQITSVTGSPQQAGDELTVKGKYFGSKPPVILIEYFKNGDLNSPKYKKCKLNKTKTLQYKDAKGKDKKSCMIVLDADTTCICRIGYSEVTVIYPKLKASDIPSGYIILDNKIALQAYQLSN